MTLPETDVRLSSLVLLSPGRVDTGGRERDAVAVLMDEGTHSGHTLTFRSR